MKRKHVKFYFGKKRLSVWRITFVKRFSRSFIGVLPNDELFLTYFCFGDCLPTALKKLSFIPKDTWEVFKWERFETLDYNLIYEL